jgi:predicted permease
MGVFTGLILKRAASRFQGAPLSGVILVEKAYYYLVMPTVLFEFVYRCLTNDIFFKSSAGIVLIVFSAFLSIAMLYVVRVLINNAKELAGSQQVGH